jgi:outer membrane protein assembly factor BamD (BamD/ComL family)
LGSRASALAEERAGVETARAAVARKDGLSALEALRRVGQKFPGGQLAEEAAALEIEALALLGRSEDARNRSKQFINRYPDSLFRPRVERTIEALSR